MTDSALIPRRLLFGDPSRMAPRISPDGRRLSLIGPVDGVLNLWVAPVDDLGAARPVTRSGRPIFWAHWSWDGRHLVYGDDANGDEDMRLWAVAPDGGEARLLTPEQGTCARLLAMSRARPGTIVVGLNDRDPAWHDAWEIDLADGARRRVFENRDGYLDYTFDDALALRLLSRQDPERGGFAVFALDGGEVVPAFVVPPEDEFQTAVLSFERAGTHYALKSSNGRNTAALFRVEAATGARTLLAEHPRADLDGVLADPTTGRIVAARFDHLRRAWAAVEPGVAGDLARLARALGPERDFNVHSQSADGTRWIVMAHGATDPGSYHLLDRTEGRLTRLFDLRPDLADRRLAPMHPVVIPSRDGLDLVSYLTLPAGVAADRPPAPLPMVLAVHGGPWGRDSYGFGAFHQWMADRGYAVLSVNYRGSTGFGKAFLNAGDREHAGRIHDDLLDAVAWAVREGIARPDRVAITGASYGGYATLVGLSFTPEVFCCGVSLVGIANLITLLENMPPYWHAFAALMYGRYADPRTEAGRAWLWSRSPLSRAAAITKPLLIGHGRNDVRCTVSESDQIVAALRERGRPVRYLVYPDEGHGFQRPENRLSFNAVTEAFFAEHLGGPCEPAGDDVTGASVEDR